MKALRLLAIAFSALPLFTVGAQENRTPVLLRGFSLLTPLDTAGTGLAPEVKLRVKIDARGRVDEVKILEIEPSSEFDELFRQKIRQSLERWRYAPKIEQGQPVPTTLEWTIQFQPRTESLVQQIGDLPAMFGEDPEQLRARILSLPLEQRKKILEGLVRSAEKNLVPGRRHRHDSPRFVVITDTKPEVAEIVANNLEATYTVLDRLFQPGLSPQPEPYKMVVFVFARRGDSERRGSHGTRPGRGRPGDFLQRRKLPPLLPHLLAPGPLSAP